MLNLGNGICFLQSSQINKAEKKRMESSNLLALSLKTCTSQMAGLFLPFLNFICLIIIYVYTKNIVKHAVENCEVSRLTGQFKVQATTSKDITQQHTSPEDNKKITSKKVFSSLLCRQISAVRLLASIRQASSHYHPEPKTK